MEKNVLIIDTNEIHRIVLSNALEKGGYTVLTAVTRQEALNMLEREDKSIDTMVVGLKPTDAINLLNSLPDPKIPIVYTHDLSWYVTKEEIREVRSSGNIIDVYLHPYDCNEIKKSLDRSILVRDYLIIPAITQNKSE